MSDALRAQFEFERAWRTRLLEASPTERPALYEEAYTAFMETFTDYADAQRRLSADDPEVRMQLEVVRGLTGPEDRVLEAGGGFGALARAWSESVRELVLLDAAEMDQGGLPENVVVQRGSAVQSGLEEGSVDVVYSCHLIEHLHPEDADAFFREALRVLRPGGLCLCITPNRLLGPHDVSRHFPGHGGGLHLREYTNRSLAGVMSAAGFDTRSLRHRVRNRWVSSVRAGWYEGLARVVPVPFRQKILHILGESVPFRFLEQVVVLGRKSC